MYKPNEQITLIDNLPKAFNLIGVPHPLGSSFTLPSLLKLQSQSNFTQSWSFLKLEPGKYYMKYCS